jgi:hypothetical protein
VPDSAAADDTFRRRCFHASLPARSRRTPQRMAKKARAMSAATNTAKTMPKATSLATGRDGATSPEPRLGVTTRRHRGLMTDRAARPTSPEVPYSGTHQVLQAIRGEPRLRPLVDLGLAGGLREWLEDGLCALPLDPDRELVVSKRTLHPGGGTNGVAVGPAIALGALIEVLFRQYVTVGRIDNPLTDGLNALELDPHRSEIVRFIHNLQGEQLQTFRDELETQAAILVSRWPRLQSGWLPRTNERVMVPLAGGKVVLIGVLDLVVGSPSSGRSSIGLVEVRSGRPRRQDRDDLCFSVLLETLRSGAPPFRAATFYTRTGTVEIEDVCDELLASEVIRILERLKNTLREER